MEKHGIKSYKNEFLKSGRPDKVKVLVGMSWSKISTFLLGREGGVGSEEGTVYFWLVVGVCGGTFLLLPKNL